MSAIAVFGASGQTGRRIVERLAQHGNDVLAISRRPGGDNGAPDANSAVADLTRSSVSELERLLDGVHAVVFAAAGDPIRVDRDGALRVIEAAERAGVARFVLITGMGVGRTRPPELHGGFWDAYFGAKEVSERVLRASSLLWTILQPGELLNTAGMNRVQLAPTGTLPIGRIARDDVAAVVAAVLEQDHSAGHSWEVVEGPSTAEDAVGEADRLGDQSLVSEALEDFQKHRFAVNIRVEAGASRLRCVGDNVVIPSEDEVSELP